MCEGFLERVREQEAERHRRLEVRRAAVETEDQQKRAAALERSTAGRFKGGQLHRGKVKNHDSFFASLQERQAETSAKLEQKKARMEQKEQVRCLVLYAPSGLHPTNCSDFRWRGTGGRDTRATN